MKESLFASTEELNTAFAGRIVAILKAAIAEKGSASLLVSGGRTPLPLFQALTKADLEWDKVTISLADERWVEPDDSASNEKLVRENLLQGNASSANFLPLKTEHRDAADAVTTLTERFAAVARPFDVLILGMGEDGHTASLFPCSEQIKQGLDTSKDDVFIAVQPTTAPHQRMSFTLKALLQSENIFLHLTGDKKKAVLEQALQDNDPLHTPILAVLQNAEVELVWAP